MKVYVYVHLCVHGIIYAYVSSLGKRTFWCVSVFCFLLERCDGCQSNARGRKGLERRQTQT